MSQNEHVSVKLAEHLTRVATEQRGFFIMGPPPEDSLEGWALSEVAATQHAVTCGDGASIWTTRHPTGLIHRLRSEGHCVIEAMVGSWHCVILRFGRNEDDMHSIADEFRSRLGASEP